MATLAELVGTYVGSPRVRPDAADRLSPAETKAMLREASPAPLEICADGTFRHRSAVVGPIKQKGEVLHCEPQSFDGMTLAEMQQRAEDAGREFGLAWLFDPFELRIEGDLLIQDLPGVVQLAYAPQTAAIPKKRGRPAKTG